MSLFLQIDAAVIDCIDDEALAVYIPTYRDRIAARRFCVQHLGASSKEPTKHSLFSEKLKKRLDIGGSDDDNNNQGTSTLKQKKR